MPKTIRELADELKVSKQTIQYHYQRLPTKNRQKDSQGKNVISLTAERIIKGKVAKTFVANIQQTGSKKATKTSKENNELIATLRREVADLKSQRDKQLATKDQQIDRLTKLVDQQQQLELVTVTENRELKDKVKRLSKPVEASDQAKQLRLNKKKNLCKQIQHQSGKITRIDLKDGGRYGSEYRIMTSRKDKEKNYPQLRFPGFTDAWELHKFFDIIRHTIDFRGRTPKKLNMDWSKSGYLALSALNVKNGYIDPSADAHYGNQKLYDKWMTGKELYKGQVLFTTEAPMGNVAQVPDNNKYILSQRTIAFDVISDKVTNDFLAVLLRSPKSFNELSSLASGGTAKGVSQKSLSRFKVILPKSLEEQQKIGSFFKQLDHLITLHQRKLEHLKLQKKGLLQKMFPKKGEVVPEIRFPGFTDAWEQRKLGNLYTKNLERNNNQFKVDRTISIATMRFKSEGNGASENSLSTYKVLREGDIAFEGHTSKKFAFGRFVLNDIGDGIMSPRFTTLRPNKEMPIKFWKQYIHYEPIMRYPIVNSTKLGTMMNELVVDDFLKQSVLVPNLEEQQKIGTFFQQLDHLITLHQRKLEKLQELKKGYLQKMFC